MRTVGVAQTFDLVLLGGTVINQDGIGRRDIGVRGGRIAYIGEIGAGRAGEEIACTGLTILPGVIDTQVHFREPGSEHKEDLETGSRAAAMGGVTTIFEMPNTDPPTTSAEALADKARRAHGRMHCDFAFWVGGTRENIEQIPELERLPGAAGIKVFMGSSTGSLLVEDDAALAAMLGRTRRRAAFHAEDEYRLRDRKHLRVTGDAASHPVWRDAETARLATERLLRIARQSGARIHVLHVSTAEEMEFLAAHKDYASVEVTPHHLTLSTEDCTRLGTRLQMNPPIRGAGNRERLWRGVEQGIADILGSDHAPHTLEEKARPYPDSPSGMTGVQTLVPVMLDHVGAGRLSLERLIDMTSAGPARLFGIAGKGRIAAGYDADFTVVDLRRKETIRNDWIASRSRWTPYDSKTVTGWPVGTFIRGRRVMWEGELVTPATGEAVRFSEVLPR
jgi:dihydroorotase